MTLLKRLKQTAADPDYRDRRGICHIACPADGLLRSWPEYSGDRNYPIPGFNCDTASAEEMWSPNHPYGAVSCNTSSHPSKDKTHGTRRTN
jgi:NAD-dependent dihydropyrimidine dehydrogenase PreA subunit